MTEDYEDEPEENPVLVEAARRRCLRRLEKQMNPYRILNGDCRSELSKIKSDTIDSIVTDPPYELGFMGKAWDSTGIAYDINVWKECLRVLKPGSYLLAFGSPRTYHRMAVAIEDAGFYIQDSIHWIHSQGFPKGNTLKPAHEPIVLARKSGPHVLNIEATRVPGKLEGDPNRFSKTNGGSFNSFSKSPPVVRTEGRWPPNVLLSEEAATELGEKAKYFPVFRYNGKASSKERISIDGITHSTIKPLELMRWLVRLVTPPNGTTLDPFAGSGTTLEAALLEGFNPIGIEMDPDFCKLIETRLANWVSE